ncbi:serine/threonine protein kinase [Kibdelosporangium aridum]|uniref:non-specific serine/threonine protein kinase n=1 Tax=Kibdelosporangium aridum TaxID=2030 RepID=A0A428YVK5_KIBAR|nr:serine/threonine-protein kinase [Kibdelosporangium aridum]RSM73841.1 serine/threonine protein kinase [Kibdelosporangium aridum]
MLADRYRIDELLGTGGMADVYRAWDTRLHRSVAIKMFRPQADDTARSRFDKEVRTLATLSHPGLVSVYDADTTQQQPFAVLQLIEGQTLSHRISEGPLSVAEVRALGAQLADALGYVHANGVIHRDVKPSNVLIDSDGTVYLSDFGLAQLIGASRVTQADMLVGTAAYLAPEQVRGEEVDGRADIYALGLVLLECLTGEREYPGNEIETAVARLHRPPTVPEDLPPDLHRLLTLMTSLTARRRPTAVQCAEALRCPSTQLLEPPPAPTPTKRRSLAAAAALVALAGATWLLVSGGGAQPTTTPPAAIPPSSTSAVAPVAEPPPSPATQQPEVVPVDDRTGTTVSLTQRDQPDESTTTKSRKGSNKGKGDERKSGNNNNKD